MVVVLFGVPEMSFIMLGTMVMWLVKGCAIARLSAYAADSSSSHSKE